MRKEKCMKISLLWTVLSGVYFGHHRKCSKLTFWFSLHKNHCWEILLQYILYPFSFSKTNGFFLLQIKTWGSEDLFVVIATRVYFCVMYIRTRVLFMLHPNWVLHTFWKISDNLSSNIIENYFYYNILCYFQFDSWGFFLFFFRGGRLVVWNNFILKEIYKMFLHKRFINFY